MAILGQPMDSVLSGLAIAAIIVGFLGAIFLGLTKYKTPKGKSWILGGSVAFVVGIVLFSMVGAPVIPGSLTPGVTPGTPGSWLICYTNVGPVGTIGPGTCPTNIVAVKAVTKSQTAPTSNFVVYYNATVTPPSGSTQTAFNINVQTGSVPSFTNTSSPSTTAPVLGLNAGGTYTLTITPASGTATQQFQQVPLSPGTSKVIAFQMKFSPIIGQLALGQYPIGTTVTVTFTDAVSGALYGTLSVTATFT